MTKSTPRVRLIALPGSQEGKARYHLYRAAYARVNEAIEKGFYLEAISIIESLISDRLESRVSYLIGKDFSFKELGSLIVKIKKEETDSMLLLIVTNRLDEWRIDRNRALHEMAKIAVDNKSTWQERIDDLKSVAKIGLKLLRDIDKQVTHLRKSDPVVLKSFN